MWSNDLVSIASSSGQLQPAGQHGLSDHDFKQTGALRGASVKLLHMRCGPLLLMRDRVRRKRPSAFPVAARKVRTGRASNIAMEENMQSITFTFTQAASGAAKPKRGFTVFWMMVLAIAILDDGERREKDRQRQCAQTHKPAGPTP